MARLCQDYGVAGEWSRHAFPSSTRERGMAPVCNGKSEVGRLELTEFQSATFRSPLVTCTCHLPQWCLCRAERLPGSELTTKQKEKYETHSSCPSRRCPCFCAAGAGRYDVGADQGNRSLHPRCPIELETEGGHGG